MSARRARGPAPRRAAAAVTLDDREIRVAEIRAPNDPSVAAIRRGQAGAPAVDPDAPTGFSPRPSPALDAMLAPLTVAEFAASWGTRHLHIRRGGQPDRFKGILSLETLDALLAEQRIPRETIMILDARADDQGESLHGAPLSAELPGLGASLYFHFLDQFSPSLRDFCDQLETSLGLPFSAFAFLNPPWAQARELHWDPLDVFILQVEGEKVWDLHEPYVHLPLGEQDSSYYRFDTPRIARVTLAPGDTLYVPRGVIHKAESTQDISFSLTIGVLPMAWHHLVRAATNRALQAIRSGCGYGAALPGWDAAEPAWATTLDGFLALTRELIGPRLARERAMSEYRAFKGPKFQLTPGYIASSYLDGDALAALGFTATPAAYHLEAGADGHELVQNGQRCVVSSAEVDSMVWMRRQRRFGSGDLARHFPQVEPRGLLQRLLTVGFVRADGEAAR